MKKSTLFNLIGLAVTLLASVISAEGQRIETEEYIDEQINLRLGRRDDDEED